MSAQNPEFSNRTFESLQALLLSFDDVGAFLQDLAVMAAGLLPGLSAGITTRYGGGVLTVASSDDRAEALDETQYRIGGGPCLDALQTGRSVYSPDLTAENRWPAFTAAARRHGLRSSLSLPMVASEITLAAVNVYSFESPDAFGPAVRGRYETFAQQAAISLRLATRQEKDGVLLEQLEKALNSRTVIDQALGILMMQQRCTAAEAFDLLRRQSQNSHRKLREVAAELVTAISGEAPSPGKAFTVD